jgi:DNA-binding SARP family transcriptional activator
VLLRTGQRDAAREVLARALAMGKADDFVLVFPWSPTGFLQDVCGSALDWGLEVAYVTSVIRRLKIPAAPGASDLWPRPVKVFTLGRFDVLIDEAPLEFGRKAPKRPLALLKFLIAQRGQASAETAIDALWPDEEADAAANALDAALHRLRKLLGHPECVTLHDGLLRLDRQRVWVDAFAFDRGIDAGESAGAGMESPRAQALRRYQGHFLAADRAEAWSISARERLRSRFFRAAAAHGEALETARDFAGAAAHYGRVIDIDDLVEAPYQGLMRCHLALGQRSEGIAAFERLRQSLAAGLGLKPTAASETLHQALRRA